MNLLGTLYWGRRDATSLIQSPMLSRQPKGSPSSGKLSLLHLATKDVARSSHQEESASRNSAVAPKVEAPSTPGTPIAFTSRISFDQRLHERTSRSVDQRQRTSEHWPLNTGNIVGPGLQEGEEERHRQKRADTDMGTELRGLTANRKGYSAAPPECDPEPKRVCHENQCGKLSITHNHVHRAGLCSR